MPTPEIKRNVHKAITAYIKFCLEAARRGVGPEVNYHGLAPSTPNGQRLAGQTLCGGWRFLFWGWKGDTKARVEAHGFKNNYQAKQ
eukprot:15458382-Alexandrium_andersonii.AAC.1